MASYGGGLNDSLRQNPAEAAVGVLCFDEQIKNATRRERGHFWSSVRRSNADNAGPSA